MENIDRNFFKIGSSITVSLALVSALYAFHSLKKKLGILEETVNILEEENTELKIQQNNNFKILNENNDANNINLVEVDENIEIENNSESKNSLEIKQEEENKNIKNLEKLEDLKNLVDNYNFVKSSILSFSIDDIKLESKNGKISVSFIHKSLYKYLVDFGFHIQDIINKSKKNINCKVFKETPKLNYINLSTSNLYCKQTNNNISLENIYQLGLLFKIKLYMKVELKNGSILEIFTKK